MKILQELIGLQGEPDFVFEAEVPVELKAVVDAFPKHHEKAFSSSGAARAWYGMVTRSLVMASSGQRTKKLKQPLSRT